MTFRFRRLVKLLKWPKKKTNNRRRSTLWRHQTACHPLIGASFWSPLKRYTTISLNLVFSIPWFDRIGRSWCYSSEVLRQKWHSLRRLFITPCEPFQFGWKEGCVTEYEVLRYQVFELTAKHAETAVAFESLIYDGAEMLLKPFKKEEEVGWLLAMISESTYPFCCSQPVQMVRPNPNRTASLVLKNFPTESRADVTTFLVEGC